MRTVKVAAAGRLYDGSPSMGTLVDEGILKKEYQYNWSAGAPDVIWTNISDDVIVKNEYDTIKPGESVTWEK